MVDDKMVARIRRNCYTCINGKNGNPVADRYQIASSITNTSFISHHTAMEYYGFSNQIFYEVYVGSMTEFKSFEFDGIIRYIKPKIIEGIDVPEFSGGIKVTNLERTVLDSIKDMDWIAGSEEVIASIESILRVNEDRLVQYLEQYNTQFLYQKTGYILQQYQGQIDLSDSFFHCVKKNPVKAPDIFLRIIKKESLYLSGI